MAVVGYLLVAMLVLTFKDASCFSVEDPSFKYCSSHREQLPGVLNSAGATYRRLINDYGGCTHIDGNLIIAHLEPFRNGSMPDLSPLETIREVSGFVYITLNSVKNIRLPNLRVIRGYTGYARNFSLSVSSNVKKNPNNPTEAVGALEELEMGNLRSIMNLGVYVHDNPGLCYFPHRVNWTELFASPKTQKIDVTMDSYSSKTWCHVRKKQPTLPPCSPTCPMSGHCWNEKPEQCQQVTKCRQLRCKECYKEGSTENCCDRECVAGCSGRDQNQCEACSKYLNGDTCESICPSRTMIENHRTVPNPNFKFTLGQFCMKACPNNYLIQGDNCVLECSPNLMRVDNECQPCPERGCPKTCKITEIMEDHSDLRFIELYAQALPKFRNCTTLIGPLVLGTESFNATVHRRERLPITDINALWNLHNLQEILGYVHFDFKYFSGSISNLTFLENLRQIRVEGHESGTTAALSVVRSPIEFLGFRSLERVEGKISIALNPKLCYMDGLNISSLFAGANNAVLVAKKLRAPEECVSEGKVCDPNCNRRGCWGPGPRMCVECKSLHAGEFCVTTCKDQPGFYLNATVGGGSGSVPRCSPCHPECRLTCTGPNDNQCQGGCKRVQEDDRCTAQCNKSRYLNTTTMACHRCHANCSTQSENQACTGPSPHPGPGGCSRCSRILVDHKSNPITCLNVDCPPSTFPITASEHKDTKHLTKFAEYGQQSLVVCKPCDPKCATCTGPSAQSGTCIECRYFWHKEMCIEHCPPGETYNDTLPVVTSGSTLDPTVIPGRHCKPCDSLCRGGCHGPTNTQCIHCLHVKIYADETKQSFSCNETCPPDRKFDQQESGTLDRICVDTPPPTMIIGVICGILVLIAIVIIVVVTCLRNKAQSEKLMEQLRAEYTNVTQPDSKNQSMFSREPNLGRLEMINSDDLIFEDETRPLGVGAFGAVYRGKWRVPKQAVEALGAPKGTQIPVAIKVINTADLASRTGLDELMDEAKVMASVSHKHCLRLIGLCMSHERRCLVSAFVELGSMDRYLRLHGRELSSLILLSWAEQIANGMAYLEARGIIHRDLATRNVLVNTPELVQITDFGLSKMLEGFDDSQVVVKSGRVPIRWLAIETLLNGVYSHKTDVWAYGVTLWEIFTLGKRPYEDVDTVDIKDHVLKGGRLTQPDICTIDVYLLMVKCWMEDAEARPTFLELMRSFSGFCKNPGRFLYIQGDEYEIKRRDDTGVAMELAPMLDSSGSMLTSNDQRRTMMTNVNDSGATMMTSTPEGNYQRSQGDTSVEPLLPTRKADGSSGVWRWPDSAASTNPSGKNSPRTPRFGPSAGSGPGHAVPTMGTTRSPTTCQASPHMSTAVVGGYLRHGPPSAPHDQDDSRYCSDPTEHRLVPPAQRAPVASYLEELPPPPPPPPNMPQSDEYLEPKSPASGYAPLSPAPTPCIGVSDDDDYLAPSEPRSPPVPMFGQTDPRASATSTARVDNPVYIPVMDHYSNYDPDSEDYLQPSPGPANPRV